ncbi:peptidoglycan D,D-transpeptidase FtsI family protein [Candidatus Margulisiibacteriota bacterium]
MSIDLQKQLRHRLWLMIFIFLLFFIGILTRLFYLQIVKYSFFKQKTVAQQQKSIKIPAKRGNILDRQGKLLATSIDTVSLYAAPKHIADKEALAEKIAPLLNKKPYEIRNKIDNDLYFVWLERKLDPKVAQEIRKMDLPGIGFIDEQKRVYPHKAFAAHVLGFVGIDDIGLGGLEQSFDKELGGEPGELVVEKTPSGEEIYSSLRTLKPPAQGHQLQLTLDEFVQFTSEKELEKAIKQYQAKGGSIIVTIPYTGEILALACYPDFDPNLYFQAADKVRVNTTLQTVYEPGSTFKVITLAGAWNEGLIDESSKIINGRIFEVGGKKINDIHAEKTVNLYAPQSPIDILVYSLNIGTAKIGLMLGKEKLYHYSKEFGFGQPTGIELSGESGGIVRAPAEWAKADEGIIPFGQGIAVTPLQLITAINVIGNEGLLLKPTLIKKIYDKKGKIIQQPLIPKRRGRVITKKTAAAILEIMKESVDRGTGIAARIKGYSVAGKTGTAEKADPVKGGYIPNEYIASFIGLVPASDPKLSILVILDTPKKGIYGGTVAAPVFRNVAEATLRYLNVPPDREKVLATQALPDTR